jgi:hypothetical protein
LATFSPAAQEFFARMLSRDRFARARRELRDFRSCLAHRRTATFRNRRRTRITGEANLFTRLALAIP